MLGLTKKTDYALLALAYLAARQHGGAVRAREIAEHHGIPTELLAKILQRLAKSGLLVSTPGPTGGYALARPADDITVGAVLEAVEGAPALAQCLRNTDNCCEQEVHCTIRRPLERISARVYDMLDAIPLSELAHGADTPVVRIGEIGVGGKQ